MVHLGYAAGLPQGLVSVLLSDDPAEVGAWLCQHPAIAKLSFTGSTATGKWLLARAGDAINPAVWSWAEMRHLLFYLMLTFQLL